MIKGRNIFILVLVAAIFMACEPAGRKYINKHYLCDFEGTYWDALVDSDPNGSNLLNGSIATSWCDEKSGLSGNVSQPFEEYLYWEGVAVSNHCSIDIENNGKPTDQLYAYTNSAYSGNNFIICNAFMNSPFLTFESKRSFIGSMQIALTTYSYNATINGNHIAPPLGKDESIWVEAVGYTIEDGKEREEATAKFYLYENGNPAFTGWKKLYLVSMCQIDKIVFNIKWNGNGALPYPAYFAIDDIDVVQKVYIE